MHTVELRNNALIRNQAVNGCIHIFILQKISKLLVNLSRNSTSNLPMFFVSLFIYETIYSPGFALLDHHTCLYTLDLLGG
jgi:hypothetical protein